MGMFKEHREQVMRLDGDRVALVRASGELIATLLGTGYQVPTAAVTAGLPEGAVLVDAWHDVSNVLAPELNLVFRHDSFALVPFRGRVPVVGVRFTTPPRADDGDAPAVVGGTDHA